MEQILRIFPDHIVRLLLSISEKSLVNLQEIRIRTNRPIELIFESYFKTVQYKITGEDLAFIINQISDYSLYRLSNELREGYITIQGGHRIGLAGQVITSKGNVETIKHIRFLNIRIAKEKLNVAKQLIKYLYKDQYLNTLIVGPPQTGKTTYLRDISRLISSGWGQIRAEKVAIIDERSEIAACKDGIPQHRVGNRTDVMDACPKAEGMMMVIRSMSPDVIVVDELGSERDIRALLEAINAGVTVISTIHGDSLGQLKKRPSLRAIFDENIFQRIIILKHKTTPGHIHKIYDENRLDLLNQGSSLIL